MRRHKKKSKSLQTDSINERGTWRRIIRYSTLPAHALTKARGGPPVVHEALAGGRFVKKHLLGRGGTRPGPGSSTSAYGLHSKGGAESILHQKLGLAVGIWPPMFVLVDESGFAWTARGRLPFRGHAGRDGTFAANRVAIGRQGPRSLTRAKAADPVTTSPPRWSTIVCRTKTDWDGPGGT